MNCHNCGQEAPEGKTRKSSFGESVVCIHCGGLMHPKVEIDTLADSYGEDYFKGSEYLDYENSSDVLRRNFTRKLKILENRLGLDMRAQRVLELGCATGEFLKICIENGASQSLGIEISEYCREVCKKSNLNVISPEDPQLLHIISEFKPTLLVAWDVWEHLYDPAGEVAKIIEACPDLKVISLTTVRFDSLNSRIRKKKWRLYHPPTHITYPTRKSFRIFFEKKGFNLAHEENFGYYRPIVEYLAALLPFLRDRLRRIAVLKKIPFYLNLFDIQLVTAIRSDDEIRQKGSEVPLN